MTLIGTECWNRTAGGDGKKPGEYCINPTAPTNELRGTYFAFKVSSRWLRAGGNDGRRFFGTFQRRKHRAHLRGGPRALQKGRSGARPLRGEVRRDPGP